MLKRKRTLRLLVLSIVIAVGLCPGVALAVDISSSTDVNLGEEYSGSITINNDSDLYRFTLPSSGTVKLSTTAHARSTNYYIYDQNGEEVWQSTSGEANRQTGLQVESNSIDLTMGTYYFNVSKGLGTGSYEFKLGFSSADETFAESEDGSDNSMSEANDVSFGVTYKGKIARNDEKDFYRFSLPSSGTVGISTTARMKRVDYYLFDESGEEVWCSTNGEANQQTGLQVEYNDVDLTSGAYYFCVCCDRRYGNDDYFGNYSFELDFTDAGESFFESQGGSDNSIAEANDVVFGNTYRGQIALNDGKDFFQFTLTRPTEIQLTSTAYIDRLDYYLYDEQGDQIWSDENTWANSQTGKLTLKEKLSLDEGVYYLCIGEGYYTGNYNFMIAVPIVKASNPMTVKAHSKSVKAKKVQKKKRTVSNAIVVSNAQGKVTYTKVKKGSSSKLTIGKKSGKITVKKGTKKGTYKIRVKVKAAGNAYYKSKTKTVTVKIRVK